MQSALGLLGFVVYIAAVVTVAAGVTWLVVKISPAKKPSDSPSA
jgi:hypothetical protein